MTIKSILTDLMAHLEWADALLWKAVLSHPGAAEDERLRFLLHHIHTVQRAFWLMWRTEPQSFPELASFPDARAIMAWGRETLGDVRGWVDAANEDRLAAPLDVPWTAGLEKRLGRPVSAATVGESVMQLAIHSAHHRGQCATRLAQVGGTAPLNDFIYWVWSGKPEGEWAE